MLPGVAELWLLLAGTMRLLHLRQELSRVKAAALVERGQAEEELIRARSQARLEEVRP